VYLSWPKPGFKSWFFVVNPPQVGIYPRNIVMGMGQNLVPLVNLKIAGKWMFITLKMVLIGIDP